MKNKVCIIGKGSFGTYLNRMINVWTDFDSFCIESPSEYEKSDVIIPAVPINVLGKVMKSFNKFCSPRTTVVDVCSVKEHSMEVLSKVIKRGTVISTHPLFGPNSSMNNCYQQKIAICSPTNEIFDELFISQLGMVPINVTAEYHDREMAKTQMLMHLICRTANNVGMEYSPLSTISHNRFMDIVKDLMKCSPQLSADMLQYNRFAKKYTDKFVRMFSEDYLD